MAKKLITIKGPIKLGGGEPVPEELAQYIFPTSTVKGKKKKAKKK